MKKIILATCSVLALTALATAGCTRTPKQGKLFRPVAGTGYKPELRNAGCTLATRVSGPQQPGKYLLQRTHTTFDKTLHTGASSLTMSDHWRK